MSGDMLPLAVLGLPVLLVRDRNGIARAFHNVCPYDGCEVSIGPQRGVETIITPYHGWKYDLDGRLLEANYFDGTPNAAGIALDSLNAGLVPIPCEEWMSTLFVHLGNRPLPFAEQYRPVLEHFEKLDLNRLQIGLDENDQPMVNTLPINANWKTVYENYAPKCLSRELRPRDVPPLAAQSTGRTRVETGPTRRSTTPRAIWGSAMTTRSAPRSMASRALPKVLNKDGSPNTVNTISNVYPNWVTTVLGDHRQDCSVPCRTVPEEGTPSGRHILRSGRGDRSRVS